MNVEIREDKAIITGYVNAVERLSKPLIIKSKKVREKIYHANINQKKAKMATAI